MRKAEHSSRAGASASEKGKEKDEEKEKVPQHQETEGEKGEGKGKEKQKEQEPEVDDRDDRDRTFKVNLKAQMGEIDAARCSARLVYDADVKRAEARRIELGAEDNSAIFTVAFTVNDGVDGMRSFAIYLFIYLVIFIIYSFPV